MDASANLPRWTRRLLAGAGIAYVFTGLSLFILPENAVGAFAWNVSPLVAMTIGGWTLGFGLMALDVVRGRKLATYHPSLLAVWVFSILQLGVLVVFAGGLNTDRWLLWSYGLALVLASASAVTGRSVLRGLPGYFSSGDEAAPSWIRWTFAGFAALVLGLGLSTLVRDAVGGNLFPESLDAITTRAFSAFLFSLGVGALPLIVARAAEPAVEYARAGMYLMVLIGVAAFSFLSAFDFATRPGGLLYLAAIVGAALTAAGIVVWHRRMNAPPEWHH